MGQCFGGVKFVVSDIPGQDKESLDIISNLKFSERDIDKLFSAFKKCDIDNSNNIQATELFVRYIIALLLYEPSLLSQD